MKATILHLHNEDSAVSTTSGHYVCAIRQSNAWHLANDDFVRVVRMNECPLLPCGILFEKWDDQVSQKTSLLEGMVCDAVSWDQCICKETECVPGSPGTHNDEDIMMPDETAESASWTQPVLTGAVRTQPAKTTVGKGLKDKKRKASDGTTAKTLLKYFKTAPSQDASDRNQNQLDRNQDQSDRNQDRSAQQRDRSGQQQDRSGRQQDQSARQQDRSARQQDQSARQQDRSARQQDRSARQQDQSARQQDRSARQQDRSDTSQYRANAVARERTEKYHVDPFMLD